ADDRFFAESFSFYEVYGVVITTQTPVRACLLSGMQVTCFRRWVSNAETVLRGLQEIVWLFA
ncbi:hypothetical protein N8586_06185, partial [Verrucomicrobiales bacterium]|nr:hypothetical protein [Verrucomicrobiales bacterium]